MTFPRYLVYRDAEAKWLGQLPVDWDAAPFKRVVKTIESGTSVNAIDEPAEDGEIGVLKTSCVYTSQFRASENKAVIATESDRVTCALRPGCLVVSRMNTPDLVGASGYVEDAPENLYLPDRLWQVELQDACSRFFAYWMQSSQYRANVQTACGGTSSSMQNLSQNAFLGFIAPIPPLPEQQVIARFLDEQTAKIDSLVAEQERLIELLQEKRQAVISHAVTKGLNSSVPMKASGVEWLGDVPAHWKVARLANVFGEASECGSADLPILSVSIHHGVSDKELGEEELDRKVSRSDDRSQYRRVVPGDLVYNMMRAWQGAFGTVTVTGMVSPAYVVARPVVRIETTFVEHILRTPQAIEEMRRHSRGVTDFRLRLYWEEFKNIVIALPALDEASDICLQIAEMTRELDQLSRCAQRAIELLSERRSALISAAVIGQIDVRGLVEQEAA